jgi:hypothetical protein
MSLEIGVRLSVILKKRSFTGFVLCVLCVLLSSCTDKLLSPQGDDDLQNDTHAPTVEEDEALDIALPKMITRTTALTGNWLPNQVVLSDALKDRLESKDSNVETICVRVSYNYFGYQDELEKKMQSMVHNGKSIFDWHNIALASMRDEDWEYYHYAVDSVANTEEYLSWRYEFDESWSTMSLSNVKKRLSLLDIQSYEDDGLFAWFTLDKIVEFQPIDNYSFYLSLADEMLTEGKYTVNEQ